MSGDSNQIKQYVSRSNEKVEIMTPDDYYLICVNDKISHMKFNKKLGEGMDGVVYEGRHEIHGKCAIKMSFWRTGDYLGEDLKFQNLIHEIFRDESKMSKKMSSLGIGPLVYKTWIGKGYDNQKMDESYFLGKYGDIARKVHIGFILMEKMEHNLDKIDCVDRHPCVRLHSAKILDEVKKHLKMLRDHGLRHSDLGYFGNNIMFNLDNDDIPCQIRLIDFARMKYSFDYDFDHYIKLLGRNITSEKSIIAQLD